MADSNVSKFFQCDICKRNFKRKYDLSKHMLVNDRGQRQEFNCSQCRKKHSSRKNLNRHVKENHQPVKNALFPCHYCKSYFELERRLKDHMGCSHGGDIPEDSQSQERSPENEFTCRHCQAVFPSVAELTAHNKSQHKRDVGIADQHNDAAVHKCPEANCNHTHLDHTVYVWHTEEMIMSCG